MDYSKRIEELNKELKEEIFWKYRLPEKAQSEITDHLNKAIKESYRAGNKSGIRWAMKNNQA